MCVRVCACFLCPYSCEVGVGWSVCLFNYIVLETHSVMLLSLLLICAIIVYIHQGN